MPRAYTLDLRERVVAAVTAGGDRGDVARTFSVSLSSVIKWCRRERETGSPAALPMGGRRPRLLEGERVWLLARIEAKPDLTLHGLLDELKERDVIVSCDTLWRFLKAEKISFKKNAVRQRAGLA